MKFNDTINWLYEHPENPQILSQAMSERNKNRFDSDRQENRDNRTFFEEHFPRTSDSDNEHEVLSQEIDSLELE